VVVEEGDQVDAAVLPLERDSNGMPQSATRLCRSRLRSK